MLEIVAILFLAFISLLTVISFFDRKESKQKKKEAKMEKNTIVERFMVQDSDGHWRGFAVRTTEDGNAKDLALVKIKQGTPFIQFKRPGPDGYLELSEVQAVLSVVAQETGEKPEPPKPPEKILKLSAGKKEQMPICKKVTGTHRSEESKKRERSTKAFLIGRRGSMPVKAKPEPQRHQPMGRHLRFSPTIEQRQKSKTQDEMMPPTRKLKMKSSKSTRTGLLEVGKRTDS